MNSGSRVDSTKGIYIALFSCLTLLVSNGMILTGLSVYDIEFQKTFGWTRGEIGFRNMITLVGTGLCAPLIGIVIDRIGVRKCMLFGWFLLGLGTFLYSRINSLMDMYLIHAIYAVVLVLCGLNAAVILVSSWFVKYRGTAIGVALVGTSLGGIFIPQYLTRMNLLDGYDWRFAFLVAVGFSVIMFLITLLFVRDKPAEAEESNRDLPVPETSGIVFQEAIRTKSFWALALIAMFTFYCALGLSVHIFNYMSDQGFDPIVSTYALNGYFAAALVGKFLFGLLSDRLPARKVFYLNLFIMFIGAALVARMAEGIFLVAMVLFGLGWGGTYTLIQLTVMNIFGMRDAGKILGTITIVDAFGGGMGMWYTGRLYDQYQSYSVGFMVFAVFVFIALLLLTQVKSVKEVRT